MNPGRRYLGFIDQVNCGREWRYAAHSLGSMHPRRGGEDSLAGYSAMTWRRCVVRDGYIGRNNLILMWHIVTRRSGKGGLRPNDVSRISNSIWIVCFCVPLVP
jgi:hypothetical protein